MRTTESPRNDGIAIVGLGCVMPSAPNPKAFWSLVSGRRDVFCEVPEERWSKSLYYDPNPKAIDRTYSKIGAFVTESPFDSVRFRIPPRVAASMDFIQQWTLTAAADAVDDARLTSTRWDRARTAVIVGNSMGGEIQLASARRLFAHEFVAALDGVVPHEAAVAAMNSYMNRFPTINEDTFPGELANVAAGRVANALDLHGKSCVVDAACASSLAALDEAVEGLRARRFDVAICGGVDRSNDVGSFIKFCKIGALSPDGSRPFDARANGFVMGEGAAMFVLKREGDAREDGDSPYAIVRGIGVSSDGRGRGITAPSAAGQALAISRAFAAAARSPSDVSLVEAHGTATPVGDVVEAEALRPFYADRAPDTVALGSVKSQIGHLKAASGAAGLLRVALAIRERVIPPTANFETPNPLIPWELLPFRVPRRAEPWKPEQVLRLASVSSFGFGGTNFHALVEEPAP